MKYTILDQNGKEVKGNYLHGAIVGTHLRGIHTRVQQLGKTVIINSSFLKKNDECIIHVEVNNDKINTL